jgi:hypothetical protein
VTSDERRVESEGWRVRVLMDRKRYWRDRDE